MNKLNNSQLFKLIITGIWGILIIFFGIMCGVNYFSFNNTDFITVLSGITAFFGGVIFGEHKANPVNKKEIKEIK